MADFNNFKIKRGPSELLKSKLLIIEEGCWYLSTDTAELFIGIVIDGVPQLKQINGELIPEVNLEGYATEDFVREAIKNIDIPEVELYDDSELRNLINSKADADHLHEEYLTEHQDISHLATKEELPNLDGYAKIEDIPNVDGFIKEIPAEYVTEEELTSKGYLTEHQSLAGYATKTYVLTEIAKAALEGNDIDLSGYATKDDLNLKADITYVDEKIAGIEIPEADLSNYYNKSEVYNKEEVNTLLPNEEIEEVKTTIQTIVPTVEKVEEILPKVEEEILPAVETVAELKAWVDNKNYLQDVDLSRVEENLRALENNIGYVKVDDRSFAEVIDETFAKKSEIPSIEGLATETYVDNAIANIEHPTVDLSEYAKKEEIPSTEGLATEEFVTEKISEIVIPEPADLSNYYNKDEINYKFENIEHPSVDLSNYALKSELPNLEGYAKLEDVPSIDGLATETFVEEKISEIVHPVIESLKDLQIGIDFETNISVGYLHSGTHISADMTFGQLLKQMLYCEHEWTYQSCGKPYICGVCGHEHPTMIAEHHEAWTDSHEPTCTSPGTTGEKYCVECGEVLEEAQEIPATGHEYHTENVEPTCEEDGYEGERCHKCSDLNITKVLPALGHVPMEPVEEDRIEPTEAEEGSYDLVVYCSRCGEELSRETIKIPMLEPEEPEIPEGTVGEIIANKLPMYSVDNNGELVAKEFEIVTFTQEEASQEPVESCFYQVKDADGNIVETGYQDMQVFNPQMYYVVALPKGVDYNSDKVSLQAYDDDEKIWNDCDKLELTNDIDTVNTLCDEAGIDISGIDTNLYTVWALEDICTGSKLRYIIKE